MTSDSTKSSNSQPATDAAVYLFDDWFDPIEAGVRDRVRGFIEAMIEGELIRPFCARATVEDQSWRTRMPMVLPVLPVTATATGRGR